MEFKPQHLRAARILHGEQWLNDAVLSIDEHGMIDAIEPYDAAQHRVVTDLGAVDLLPGLIDSHVHGAAGHDVMDATHEALDGMSRFFSRYGVTAFVATTVSAPAPHIQRALRQIALTCQHGTQGAQLLGAYLEGPFFSAQHKGAHPEHCLHAPTLAELTQWISDAAGHLCTVALAPELPGALECIRYLKAQGIRVMLGHSDATYEQVSTALHAGADGVVHCYNGMRGLHHREPGVVGAALTTLGCYTEIIADGHHVHPAALQVAYCCCQQHLLPITDAMRATGMPDGRYRLGEYEVTVQDGVAMTDSGSLAGSTLTLLSAVNHLRQWLELSDEEAWLLASRTPARLLGLDNQMGTLEAGKRASLVAVTGLANHADTTSAPQIPFSVLKTWVNGRLVFDTDSAPVREALCI